MKLSKVMVKFTMLVFIMGLLAACGNGDNEKKLIMLTSAEYYPFESVDTETNEIIGIDVDIAKYITNELGYELEIKDMDFATLITAMNSGKGDFILAGMSPNPDRLKNADFSDNYFYAEDLLVTKKDSGIEAIEDLEGKTVGYQTGSIQEGQAERIAELVAITTDTRNRIPELVQEIKAGRFDAAIIENIVAAGHLKNNEDLVGIEIEGSEESGFAIAFKKDSELKEEFNRVLKEMMENGELDKIVNEWLEKVEE